MDREISVFLSLSLFSREKHKIRKQTRQNAQIHRIQYGWMQERRLDFMLNAIHGSNFHKLQSAATHVTIGTLKTVNR